MKREGRQHGMVRAHQIMPNPLGRGPETRLAHRLLDGPAMAGSFVRVWGKPTNHSKFTSKCGSAKGQCKECHLSPACKAKSKTKGNHKINSNDDVSDQLASYYDHDDDYEEERDN